MTVSEDEMPEDEAKIVYRDGDRVRAIRGRLVDYGSNLRFVTIERDDGRYLIAREEILRIEQRHPWPRMSEDMEPKRQASGPLAVGVSARNRDNRDVFIVAP